MDTRTTTERVAAASLSAMEARGISVYELARRTGIARSTLNRRLSGYSPFTLRELDAISTALNLEPGSLVGPVERSAS